ncbi:50S ribosomal protein L6 [Pseudogracilibacillus auburnensis]|uniref:Large ribosomal subunit protein uL6 n=1 Tax=Pseudogracilibacillus auburnensis TaxID=1494959 RepID=A0A2V3VVT7_9BACI|nr:50S ribosomal protein L6 [Pseudogracilibacillus auburnensis]PXW84868.1 LSU ribosomal protein L6P [Pseudogracilibacillus auburnensis]
MSRIGLRPIEVPEGVDVKIDNNKVSVKGPKGELSRTLNGNLTISLEDKTITVERPNDDKENRSLHGTTRSLIFNMIEGVSKGFQKELEIIGVGYRAQKQGNKLVVSAGYSHPVEIEQEDNIEFDVPKNTEIIVKGIDKERVGAVAANIRAIRPPEPYKGKGIRYKGEYVRRKEGKTAK